MVKNTVDGGAQLQENNPTFCILPDILRAFFILFGPGIPSAKSEPKRRLSIWFRYYLKRFKRVGKGRVLQLFPPLSTFREGFAPEALAHVIFSRGWLSGNQEQFQRKGGN